MPNFYSTLRRFALTALLSGGGLLAAQAQTLSQPVSGATTVAGTYTDLGTTGTVITTANFDNANSAAQNIGFSFGFNGTVFTQFVLNTNGVLRLGSAAPSSASLFIDANGVDPVQSSSSADVNLLMPFNIDLMSGTGGAEYRVLTTGTAGSRICTIQWKNVADKTGSGTTNTQQFSNFSFQVKLYEGVGTIEFVYDAPTASAAATNSRDVNLGLKGSGIGTSQLLLATKASTTAWASATFQNTAYGFVNTFNVDKSAPPTAGRTYRFTDPTYCVSAPVTAYPYTQNFDGVTAPTLPCGMSVIDANGDNNTWANYNSTTYSASTPNSMRYTGGTVTGNDWFFTNALTMTAGMSYQLQFKYRSYTAAYTQALEVKVGTTATVAGQTTTVFTNTGINNATYNTTTNTQVVIFTPTVTGTYYYGFHAISPASRLYLYVDDVQVSEVATPACPQPINLAATNITSSGATITFTPPTNGTTYSVIYGAPSFNPASAGTTTPLSSSTSVVLSNLTQNSSYDVYVQATCGASGTSLITGPISFMTTCATVTTFPYFENFDGVTAPTLPCGITVIDVNNDAKTWTNISNTTYSASGSNAMTYSWHGTNAANDWFFTNALQMQAGSTYQLQFKYRGYGSLTEAMEVKVGASPTVAGQTTTVFSNTNFNSATYTTTTAGTGAGQVTSFTPNSTGTYYFGFHAISPANQWYIYVDDVRVTITSLAACPTPTNVTLSGITANTASVSFTGPAGSTGYTIIYGPRNFDPNTSGTSVPATASPFTLTGLTAVTNYDVYVKATCGSNGASLISAATGFTTACATTVTFPYQEKFDGVTAPALPCGVSILDANNDGNTWVNSTFNPSSGVNSMRYNPSAVNPADDWFFTNALALKANMKYQLQFKYRVFSYNYPEKMEVKIGNSTTAASQTTTLFSNMAIINSAYTTTSPGAATGQVASFTPAADGTYFIGFHAMSIANSFDIYVDDVSVEASAVTATRSNVAPGFSAEASPVPFSDHLTLNLKTLAAGPLQLTLHDGVGRVVRETSATVPAGASSLAVPNAGTLPAGIYILTVRQGGNTQVIRVAHE